jgi:hypothetical protein
MRLQEKLDSPEFEVFIRNSAYLKKQYEVAKANLDEARLKLEDNVQVFNKFLEKELVPGKIMLHITPGNFKLFSVSSIESIKYDSGKLYTYLRVSYSNNGVWSAHTEPLALNLRQVMNLRLFTDDLIGNDISPHTSSIYNEL